ncbi:AAA domain-containing protein [Glycomyces sp. TRM65418]|uniref:AAA domain-containing protein n=1 Tax=Glycomyces sp. TRM65418 TaxID=2867006 RepID=UPI001CE53648|nr:AAA domain-containing protein [Glycomyces sp. TRM65418]MCC3764923.1 AAA domain-containing protein [Glycomyces sp. TRM65418]QZD54564.1 AAA family ATPase [Glycomyces sp. TRM65418]
MSASRLLLALADLAPAAQPSQQRLRRDHLGDQHVACLDLQSTRDGADLAKYDELHRDERLLRQGWGMVTGLTVVDGKTRRVRLPLVSRPVRLQADPADASRQLVIPAGDIEVHSDLVNTGFAFLLESVFDPEKHETTVKDLSWLPAAAAAAGFPDVALGHQPPPSNRLEVVPMAVVYISPEANPSSFAKELSEWAKRPDLDRTAFAAMYDPAEIQDVAEADTRPPWSPLPLSGEQAAAVVQARTAPVTVIAGAPGCGKSHTLAAIALDAIANGQSVLIAAQSVHAADVLAALIDRHPGPLPVHFGDSERRQQFLSMLGWGTGKGHKSRDVERCLEEATDAMAYVRRTEAAIAQWLELETRRGREQGVPLFLLDDFPGLREADLDHAERLLAASLREGGWWRRLRARSASKRLRRLAGGEGSPSSIARAVRAARDQRELARLAAAGGLRLAPLWERLENADAEASKAIGHYLNLETGSADRRDAAARRALAELANALRTGNRPQRRSRLMGVNREALLRAMPLWIGTVADVEDVLPARAGMFDLVILDEASHINQLRAAPVLARARRAVVAGDPKQLRFVSFASAAKTEDVLHRHGLSDRLGQLDIGKVSAYDLACGAGPVIELTEHHRSVPHLIGFSAAKFYHGRVRPTTTHPRNHEADVIAVHRVAAKSSKDGVVEAEVQRSVELLSALVDAGEVGLAVISPFRAQAEAIEAAILERFDLETIRRHRLRTGTVHAFQGSEAGIVIVALGVAGGDAAGRRRFAAGANLFNVMVTRARHHLHVVTAIGEADGLIGEFLRYADRPPRSPGDGAAVGKWTGNLADALEGADVPVRQAYPVGHWTVDLVVGEAEQAIGVIAESHPEGPSAHIARHRALRRAGWRIVEAFPSAYDDDPSRAAIDVLAELDRR